MLTNNQIFITTWNATSLCYETKNCYSSRKRVKTHNYEPKMVLDVKHNESKSNIFFFITI
jgi:hypothetical protein